MFVELSPEPVSAVAEPGALSVAAEPEVSVPGAVSVAEPEASFDIAAASVVLVPASVVAEVESSGRPRFLAFPNVDYFASSSNSAELAGWESVHSSNGARTNYGLGSTLSNLDLYQNKSLEHRYNNPNPGYSNESGTNVLPKDATTSRSRRRDLHQYQGQRKHTSRAARSTPEVRQTEWAEGGWPLRSCRGQPVPHTGSMPLLGQDRSPLKKYNGRIPRIRCGYSCNKPLPHILLVGEG